MNRADSSAICTFIPKSTTLATNCACACDWFQPPMMPKPIVRSSFFMNAGMIVCSGRLRPASEFGLPGLQVEARAAIVEREAGAGRHIARSVSRVVALDQRNDIAFLVDRRHVDGLAPASVQIRA